MCGITGFFGEDKARIDAMTNALVHRGPDGNATLVTDGASLGHARLAILDPSPAADQPMWNDAKTAVMVYNGEIFNYRELRAAEKFDCVTSGDTEVLLKLYDKYGIGFVKYLRGMFAFGLYDITKKTWYLARDSGGIKPLFVSYPNGKLHFASEMRSLMKALPKKPELNMEALSQYVRLHYVPGPHTLCQGIESVPPGTVIAWNEHGEARDTFAPMVEPVHYGSRNDFRAHFPELMDMVVAGHLVSDKPVGLFLSGGMDSSIVLHHMSNHAKKPVKTFTVRFEATADEDEARFNKDAEVAKLTAKHYGTDHREVVLTAALCRDIYADAARSLDQPNADSVAMAQFVLSREAKKHVDVVLSGAGGDELFGGYPRYRIAQILHSVRHVPASLRAAAAHMAGQPVDVLRMQPGPELAERLLARATKETRPLTRGSWYKPEATTTLFRERFARLPETMNPVRAMMEFDRDLWLVDESLRLCDGVTMASGLECRVPFVDPLVIAASHGTRTRWHMDFRRTKT
ncbi:MAG TPA: asparagine synthase (glutamine-hydrolyzing), partial [Candidatus Peribacteria bacterium]|nr:asparagine synthase (glutamine-hydrolyzing) [Candidatus Peribacteria bacterium]